MSTERNVVHATFALKRTYSAPRARVFDAFADFEKKKQWFGSDDPADHTKASMEFRVGGREHAEGSAGAMISSASTPSISTSSRTNASSIATTWIWAANASRRR